MVCRHPKCLGADGFDRTQPMTQRSFQCRRDVDRSAVVGGHEVRRRPIPVDGAQLQRDGGDHPEAPGRSDKPVAHAGPGIVLAEAPEVVEDRSGWIGKHHLQPQHAPAHVTVMHHAGAAGVGGHHAADRGIGSQIDGKGQPVGRHGLVQAGQQHPGTHHGGAVGDVDLQAIVQTLQRQHRHGAKAIGY